MEEFVVSGIVICFLIFLCCVFKKNFNEEEDADSAYLNVSRDRTSSEESSSPENNINTELPNITLNNLLKENINNIIENNSFSYVSEVKHNNCIICLDDMEKGDEIRTLRCMHKFHKSCIDDWLKRQNLDTLICPICDYTIMEIPCNTP